MLVFYEYSYIAKMVEILVSAGFCSDNHLWTGAAVFCNGLIVLFEYITIKSSLYAYTYR